MARPAAFAALVLSCLLSILLVLPSAASASVPRASGSGGSGLGGSTTTGTPTTTTSTTPTSTTPLSTSPTGGAGAVDGTAAGATSLQLGTMVWASGDGITVGVTGSVLKGHSVTFEGSAPLTDVGDSIVIRYASASATGGYVTAAEANVLSTGSFSTVWTASASGRLAFTAVLVPPGAIPAADPLSIGVSILVFKSAIATIYGPGLWGHRTACGERLRKTTLGVANRTLKCGTKVAVYYGNRELVVPVIDRGPFTNHASWDLTEAAAKALGANHTVTVGTIAPWSPSQQSSARS